MYFPLVDFDLPIYKFPTVELIVEVLSLSFDKEAFKLSKRKGTEPLSLLLLASGVQTPSTKQGRRGASTEQREGARLCLWRACFLNGPHWWLC